MSIGTLPGSLSKFGFVALVVLLVGCGIGGSAGSREDAGRLVESYLTQLTTDSPDKGWGLLHPVTQQTHFNSDEEQYLSEVQGAVWKGFSWTLQTIEEDEPGSFEVAVDVADDAAAPPFLRSLATFMQGGVNSPDLTFYVKYRQLNGTGIYDRGTDS